MVLANLQTATWSLTTLVRLSPRRVCLLFLGVLLLPPRFDRLKLPSGRLLPSSNPSFLLLSRSPLP